MFLPLLNRGSFGRVSLIRLRQSRWLPILVALLFAASANAAQEDTNSSVNSATDRGTRLLRDPDIHGDQIVFVHANDLWRVGKEGGQAVRMTTDEGQESDPCFSPDGKWIAFTGQYNGNSDVYVIPATGGTPKQLTWHPGPDVVQGWTPDGQVMFQSRRDGRPTRVSRFFTVPVTGGLPTALALPQANVGEMSPDGQYLAYQENRLWDPEWRNYRGGQAKPISIVSTKTWDIQFAPWEGERHLDPVWLGEVVYYLSERDYAANVWSFNPRTKEHRQMTHHRDFDVKSIGAGTGSIVYEQGGYLHLLDTKSAESQAIVIQVEGDRNYSRPRWEEISSRSLTQASLSPTGKRALFQSRGDLFTIPLDKGSWRNLTDSSDVADRYPVWSPDGQNIAWFHDPSGEYVLAIGDQSGKITRQISIPEPSFFFQPSWSPDGKKIAMTDTDYRVLIVDLDSEETTHVDTDRFAHPERSMNPVWSPDSRWLAYARRLDNQLRAIIVYDTQDKSLHQITDGMADAISPVWDAQGQYLYFLASTDYGLNTGWLDMTSYDRPVSRSMYMVLLDAKTKSPFLPVSDEEPTKEPAKEEPTQEAAEKDAESNKEEASAKEDQSEKDDTKEKNDKEKNDKEKNDKENGDKAKDSNNKSKTPTVTIDFDNLAQRILAVPGISEGEYAGLIEGPEGKVFVLDSEEGKVLRYSVKDQKTEDFAEKVSQFTVSQDRKTVLFQSGSSWQYADTNGSGKSAKPLSVGNIQIKIDPRQEWRQMLREGWRFMRDFLYVDNVHGADWERVWTDYSPWLEHVHHRSDFNYLLDMLSGEVAVGHSYVVGGDLPELPDSRTGLLGADLEVANGRIRIAKLLSAGQWNPGLDNPLATPGLDVKEGDYLIAIQGRELTDKDNPYQFLENTQGRTITIRVNDQPQTEGSRELFIKPLSSESSLRTWDWVNANQKRVDELSDGKLAYVWLPNTGRGGYSYFNRMYFAQQDRQGAVIDERNNGGGSAADYIIEILSRQLTGYFNSRAGDRRPFTQPMAGLFGPKVMIINESAGSGGDLLPYLFRLKKLGPLVGTRTWGGLVGTWDTPPLIDGGRFVAPRGGFFDLEGEWAVEGEGVAPDREVRNDPRPVIDGGDPQLEAAVAEALKRLETEKVERKPEPPAPIRALRPAADGNSESIEK